MRTLVECNLFLFLASLGMLFFILRYRVHLHLEYTPRSSKRRHHRIHPERVTIRGTKPASVPPAENLSAIEQLAARGIKRDLESALENLGAGTEEAKARAAAAIAQGPGDFDALILRAMQSTGNRKNPRR